MTTQREIESIFRKLMEQSNAGAQRTPLVPILPSDPLYPAPGTMWAREDQSQVYLKLKNSTVALVNTPTGATSSGSSSSPGTVSTAIIGDRALGGIKLSLNTVTSDEIASNAVGNVEIASGAVDGRTLSSSVMAASRVDLSAPNTGAAPLTLRGIPGQTAPLISILQNATARFQVLPDSASVGAPLLDSAFSVQDFNPVGKVLLRLRGGGGSLLRAEDPSGNTLFDLDGTGGISIAGKFVALGGAETSGALAVNGPLTVTGQVNQLAGVAVTGAFQARSTVQVDGRATFAQGPFLPTSYSARVGSAVWLRTTADPNRMTVEGVSDTSVAEVQLGTAGPVLSGAASTPSVLRVNGVPLVSAQGTGSNVGRVVGSQLGFDTVTGGGTANVGNLAASTVWTYNLRDAAVTRSKLTPSAVGAAEIAAGVVDSNHIVSMYVDRLISGQLNADEIFMGPSGAIYAGPLVHSEITGERVQLDAFGLHSYNAGNVELAAFTPGGFRLRSGSGSTRAELTAADGLALYQGGTRTARFGSDGAFALASVSSGGSTRLSSDAGLEFVAGAVRNVAFNPGFEGGTAHGTPQNMFAVDDQLHVFLGEYALRSLCNSSNVASESFVDIPFGHTVGTSAAVQQRARENFALNPALRTAATGWSGSGTSVRVNGRSMAGGFYRPYVFSVTALSAGTLTVNAPGIPVTPGTQLTFSAQARISQARSVKAQVVFYNAAGTVALVRESDTLASQAADINRYGRMCYVPDGAVRAVLQIVVPNVSAQDTLEVSCALYERESVIGEYADGDSPGWQFSGDADASSSYSMATPYTDSVDNLVSVFVWSDNPVYVQAGAWDAAGGVRRGFSTPTLLVARRWNRVWFLASGVCDRIRVYAACTDAAMQVRYLGPVWWSGLQVEQSPSAAPLTRPAPLASGSEPGCRWEGIARASSSLRAADTTVAQFSPAFGVAVSGALVGGSFSGGSIFGSRVVGSEIYGGRIVGNEIDGARIVGTSIMGSTITGTNIMGNTITGSTINGGSISGTTITGASVSGTSMSGSRFVVGVPGAARLEIEGRSGMTPRLFLTNSSNVLTFNLDAASGDVTMRGEFRTADVGERIVISENGVNEFRFYPVSGTSYARLYAGTSQMPDNKYYGNLLMSGPTYNNRESYIWATSDNIQIYRGTNSGADQHGGGLFIYDTYMKIGYKSTISGPDLSSVELYSGQIIVSHRNTNNVIVSAFTGTDTFAEVKYKTHDISIYDNGFAFTHSTADYAVFDFKTYQWKLQNQIFICDPLRTALYFANTGFDVYNYVTGDPRAIGASAFVVKSGIDTKTNIVEGLPFDPVEVIRDAPSASWERRSDRKDSQGQVIRERRQFGPMAENLPASLRVRSGPDNSLGVDLGSQLAVSWAATAIHADQIDELKAQIDELKARFDALELA